MEPIVAVLLFVVIIWAMWAIANWADATSVRSSDREEARALSVKIAVMVAMADGALADSKGETLKRWITNVIDGYEGEKRDYLKRIYNAALMDASTGNETLSSLTHRLNEIGERRVKVGAVELCLKVMSADGVLPVAETEMIDQVAASLGIDGRTLEIIRDGITGGKDLKIDDQSDIEILLGIDPDWSSERRLIHLRDEFSKWNGRLNTLPAGPDREDAQYRLERISEEIMRIRDMTREGGG